MEWIDNSDPHRLVVFPSGASGNQSMTQISSAQQVGPKTFRVLIWKSFIVYLNLVYRKYIIRSNNQKSSDAYIFQSNTAIHVIQFMLNNTYKVKNARMVLRLIKHIEFLSYEGTKWMFY